jgi:hypothetical protein
LEDCQHAHWIGGERRNAAGGGTFQVPRAGTWSRAGQEEVRDALSEPFEAWSRTPAPQRREVLAAALADLAREPDPHGLIARALGLTQEELGEREAPALKTCLDDLPTGSGGRSVIVRAHWSELLAGLARAVCHVLACGDRALVLSDRCLPVLADRLAEALYDAGLPAGALAVLHDDGETVLRHALASGNCARLDASGPQSACERLEQLAAEPGGREAGLQPFGAGVLPRAATPCGFTALTSSVMYVGPDDEPVAAAREAAERSLGRVAALSGQAPGQVGQVRCHPRHFSAFTEALLSALDGAEEPLFALDRETDRDRTRAREMGLDEGAALIWEGASSSPQRGRDARLEGLVFTNVESRMRIADRTRPAPLLLLTRETDGE